MVIIFMARYFYWFYTNLNIKLNYFAKPVKTNIKQKLRVNFSP